MSFIDDSESDELQYCGNESNRSIVGDFCQLIYLFIWLSSLSSPLIISIALYNHWYFLSSVLIGLTVLSYLPRSMDHILFSRSFRNFMFYGLLHYYKNCSIRWVKGSHPHSIDEIQDPNNDALPTLFCVHPHGIFCQSWAVLFGNPFTVETVFLFSNTLFASPFFRLLSRIVARPSGISLHDASQHMYSAQITKSMTFHIASGCDKVTMQNNMRLQRNCGLIPGGFHDASIHCLDVDRVCLKNRKGFVKYAIQYQYSLTPVFGFGEKDTFYNVQGAWSLRLWLNDFGIPGILPFGRWICPILPRNDRLHVVVGEPLKPPKLPKDGKVTREMVDEHHAIYIAKLKAMYKKYSIVYGKECELEVW